jgi:uncharacterized membrane protein
MRIIFIEPGCINYNMGEVVLRVENFKFGLISVLLAFAIMFSMVFVLPPVSAGLVNSYPTGTITVQTGQTFVLRHELVFNQAQPGYFAMAINWVAPSSDENFTLDNASSVYWISGPENGLPVENVQWTNNSSTDGWTVGVFIDSADKNYVNGKFNVDVWLRARSGDGTPHRLDNQLLDYGPGILLIEPGLVLQAVDPVTVQVIGRGVDATVSPENQTGGPSATLNYTVTVKNTGNLGLDNYNLTVSDNAGWTPTLDNYRFENVPENVSRTTTLHVHIPDNAVGNTNDNVIVRATSQGDNTKSDNASCTAKSSITRGVQVVITPPSQENENGRPLVYTVMVKNTGNVGQENFQLTKGDNAGWTPSLDNNFLLVPKGENKTTQLTVNIPSGAVPGTWDNIWVKATSQDDNAVFDNKSCLARAMIIRGVQVVITPPSQENENGRPLAYTVTVTNTGNVLDNYTLTRGDNAGWGLENLVLDNYWLLVSSGGTGTTTLRVTIPANATGGTWDNIWVKATSQRDNTKSDNENCRAHVIVVRVVDVSISPRSQGAIYGSTVNFTVTVKNMGNVQENYILTKNDNAAWGDNVVLDNNWLVVLSGKEKYTTLRVTIPDYVTPGTIDNIAVTGTSKDDNTIKDNDSCVVLAVPCTGTANIRLATGTAPFVWGIRKVRVTTSLVVYTGDNLRLRFLAYDNVTVESENVIWSRTAPGPQTVTLTNLVVPHDIALLVNVHRVKLVLTDNSGVMILDNMAWYTPVQDDWGSRVGWIVLNWASHNSSQQDQLGSEIGQIVINWSSVPTTADQHDF